MLYNALYSQGLLTWINFLKLAFKYLRTKRLDELDYMSDQFNSSSVSHLSLLQSQL